MTQAREPDRKEQAVIDSCRRHLSRNDRFWLAPNIPADKLKGAETYVLPLCGDELLVAIYDNSAFVRDAGIGVVFTTRGFYWRRVVGAAEGIKYSAFSG